MFALDGLLLHQHEDGHWYRVEMAVWHATSSVIGCFLKTLSPRDPWQVRERLRAKYGLTITRTDMRQQALPQCQRSIGVFQSPEQLPWEPLTPLSGHADGGEQEPRTWTYVLATPKVTTFSGVAC